MPRARTLLAAAAAALALTLAACGDDDRPASGSGAAQTGEAASPPPSQEISTNVKEKPAVPQPSGEPPPALQKEDVVVGTGRIARKGDNVSVQYVGINWSNGAEFDASWNRGPEPFTFTLGSGQVIPGWDRGVAGMKVGGRRKLVIPPDLAYGEAGQPPTIPPSETLVFVIDLQRVQRGR